MTKNTAVAGVADPALLPITDPQKGLLVVDSRVPTREIYNQIMQFDLDPRLSDNAVDHALAVLVTVQPALRQVFGHLPRMHSRFTPLPEMGQVPFERVDVPPGEYAAAAEALATRLGQRPFDLVAGPAYRFGYVRATDGSAAAILLCGHHIIGDGVSTGPIIRDLESALTSKLTAEDVETLREARESAFLRELEAQNRASGSPETAEHVKVWAEQLRGVPPLVLNPRPGRPKETDFSGARLSWLLGEREASDFQETCKRLSVTPFVLLSAVYGAVLARYGGVSTVLIGSPLSARRTVRSYDLCGFFVNTLPVTVDVDWSRTVDEHIAGTVREAVDHCRARVAVTLNQLVAGVGQDRTSNRNPLFSCMLAMQDTFDGRSTGAVVGVREPRNGTAKFDLWLGATKVEGRWLLELEYDRHLISEAVADSLLASLRTALRRTLEDGTRRLADLFTDGPLPDTAVESADAGRPASAPAGDLAEWIEQAARRTSDAIAVEEPLRNLTYGELLAAAERTADGLARRGITPGQVVGLALDGLCDTVIAMLAILRCGATYLPLDPSLPWERLAHMVDQAGCRLIVGRGLNLPGTRTTGLAELSVPGDGPRASGGSANSAVYLMFTSGSSGVPKGVVMGHRPLLNLAAWQISAMEHDGTTRFLQYAPLGFDVSFQEIIPTLVSGGTVVSREPADRRDFPALIRRIEETRVSHVFLPVAALRSFVQAARRASAHFPGLRRVCVSGEQLLVDDEIRRFFVEHPECVLVNLYGPTETNAATVHEMRGDDARWPAHAPIGRPLPGVAAYVVDGTGHLAPVGVPGELHLGGVSPADGYLDAERTAASFLPDRFSGDGTSRVYRTGDQVVRDADGTLTFLGRQDSQTKIRGNRVELGEIEAVANTEAGVRQSVAVARGLGADRELVLFLVAESGADPDHAELQARLSAALPSYMSPSWIFDADRIPTSRTGKTDRDALVALADRLIIEQKANAATTTVEYASDLERGLAAIWSSILETDGIVRDRSLIDYGAHSLNAFTAFAEIEEEYGTTVPAPEFFRSPTIATLAELVRASLAEDEAQT
ncbi:amino acid adenylation domain-containing protein [Streptomyces scopuliridis]|uniref:Amino acid adenylation domain-containing protein n=1 Tax=Streptomyces scopuliridis TaxID=452529 RepID=A0ACD4ZBM6_9ACTN|nr:amino acid adenylation domain-containing protein [Streptomyces scopuliridis]WSB95648.1 amino acid adenylation domain-containing protein [Streptomyces scopuliridis]WSC10643.1 amino acid adenylation domain-containing protein [Streptomyces scopuliridis]